MGSEVADEITPVINQRVGIGSEDEDFHSAGAVMVSAIGAGLARQRFKVRMARNTRALGR
jgi:hypothetical protein